MNYIVDHMKILKVIGTSEALQTVQRIVQYFEEKENYLEKKKITRKLKSIANRNRLNQLDSDEKAEFLRNNFEAETDKIVLESNLKKKDDVILKKLENLEDNFNKLFVLICSQNNRDTK